MTGPDPKTQAAAGSLAQQRVPRSRRAARHRHLVGEGNRADNRDDDDGLQRQCSRSESQFAPLEKQDLDTIFGKDGYKLAEDVQTLETIETIGRLGTRFFPG